MPLYKTIHFNYSTQILIWKITESLEELLEKVVLKEKSQLRLSKMKSEMHQRAFLSVRLLLEHQEYSDFELNYDQFGKPYLSDGKKISISHSHHFSTIIISNKNVGIDIEMQKEKIKRIADKFLSQKELYHIKTNNSQDYINKLTVVWGAKEAIFKIKNEKGISFKNHIQINSFEIKDQKGFAVLEFENVNQHFNLYFEEFDNFILVFAFEDELQ